jgi:hypothetical protein
MNLAEIFDTDSILCNHRRDRMLVGFATKIMSFCGDELVLVQF